jgi:hypothetical protein
MTPEEEVYRKLFRSLEEDAAKQGSEVLGHLQQCFSCALKPLIVLSTSREDRCVA